MLCRNKLLPNGLKNDQRISLEMSFRRNLVCNSARVSCPVTLIYERVTLSEVEGCGHGSTSLTMTN
jgi:hypothetical protein